ncbi:hypothetical protein [Streptomyces sp. NPDC020917]|uniref:hypothetical protein n=1 Tax=Streptomyces sp. NPDC020917 TaxID=3365102 RepID=UPI0037A53F46
MATESYDEQVSRLGESARGIWQRVTEDYELAPHELRLLLEVCRCADTLDALAADIEERGVMLERKVNPAVVESRQMSIAFARLVSALALPELDEDAAPKYVRTGTRGPYRLIGGAKNG